MLNNRQMSFSSGAAKTSKAGDLHRTIDDCYSGDLASQAPFIYRRWGNQENKLHTPTVTPQLKHNIGQYPLTSGLANWVSDSFRNYKPSQYAEILSQPLSTELHEFFEKERAVSTGLHNLCWEIPLLTSLQVYQTPDVSRFFYRHSVHF